MVNQNASALKDIVTFNDFVGFYKDKIYAKLVDYMPEGEPTEFIKMVRSYVDRKGQYRRPAYVVLWNLLYGGNEERTLLPAAVQQISEDYFLMHDDWMDNNTLRRGLPAAHVLYGPVYAITAGDLLHTIMWRMTYDVTEKMNKETKKRYIDKLYEIMKTTHIGQYYDIRLTTEIKDITKFTPEDYYQSIHAKSACYSVYGPMQQGAIIAEADNQEVEKIKEYGIPIGNAFQIKDDILDCASTDEVLGKSVGNDVREGVKTIILWHAVQNASTETLKKLKEIYAKDRKNKTEKDVQFVLSAFKELGSIDYAQKEAERMGNDALESFNKLTEHIAESNVKNIARDSFSAIVKRNK